MNPLKTVTKVLDDTTGMVNAGKHLGHALGFNKHDKHHDIHGHESYLKPGKHHDIK